MQFNGLTEKLSATLWNIVEHCYVTWNHVAMPVA